MTFSRLKSGKKGEGLALFYLKRKGYKIIEKNYKACSGEIDIIARDRGVTCFIEVKTRKSRRFGLPQESVNRRKQLRIAKVALMYIKNKHLESERCRFDVVGVEDKDGFSPNIDLIKDAFELNQRYKY